MAETNDQNDPQNMGQSVLQGIPGYSILQMLKGVGRGVPEGWEQIKQLLGLSQTPPPPQLPRGQAQGGPMPTPRDAMGRPLPIDPQTGLPINYPPPRGGSY